MGVYIDGNRVYGLKEARKLLGFETLPQFRRYLAKIGFIEINHKGPFSRSKHVIYKSNKKRGQWGHSVKLFITQDGLNELKEMRGYRGKGSNSKTSNIKRFKAHNEVEVC